MADPGWYPDAQDASLLRYFDGQGWTAHTRPAADALPPPQGQPDPRQQQWTAPPSNQPTQQFGAAQPTQQFGGPPQQNPGQQQYPSQQYPAQQQYPPAYSAPQYGPPQQAAPPYGGYGYVTPEPPKRRSRRKPLFITLAAVVVIAAGLVTFFLVSGGNDPQFTYHGKSIAASDKVLAGAESKVRALVKKRHGAQNGNTRCYFAKPTNPAHGAKKTDVDSALRCGPVLFVDGDAARQYLPVPLTQTSSKGSQAKLTTSGSLDDADPVAISSAYNLTRPDGESAPKGAGGLKVPGPPPAATDALIAAELGSTSPPKSLKSSVMVSKDTKITLLAAGEISRYGTGDSARSTPDGKKLVAFRVASSGGDLSDAQRGKVTLTISGTARPLPDLSTADQWIIAAVPSSGGAALTLAADGYTQSLSLPDGRPSAINLAVLLRKHRNAFLFKSFNVPVKVSDKDGSGTGTLRSSLSLVSLNFWIPGHTDQHARSPKNAILSIALSSTFKGQSARFAFDASLLKLRLPNGQVVGAHDVQSGDRVQNVFEVPADFSRGTLQISGSEKAGRFTLRIAKTTSVTVTIPAG